MNSTDLPQQQKTKKVVRAAELLQQFDALSDSIQILSLDCFDTLLWRHTVLPTDVFFDLQKRPAFQQIGLTAFLRVQAERNARALNQIRTGLSEVSLADIYRAHRPDLSSNDIEKLIADELVAEKDTCYAFTPVVELIRHANQKNKKIVIASDTYFTSEQLKILLRATLPETVFKLIHKIYCSVDYGYSKSRGLLKLIAEDLGCAAQQILHIGDHPLADVESAQKANCQALQLQQYDESVAEMLRMQSIASCIFDPAVRQNKSMANPFKPILAAASIPSNEPEKLIGYAAVGPILYIFANYLLHEVEKLQRAGKQPKLLFIMRDAYLPQLACEALQGESVGYSVRISRFTAYAASFRSKEDVEHYLAATIKNSSFADICRQLLLPEKLTNQIIATSQAAEKPHHMFVELIYQPVVLNIIFAESARRRERLIHYVVQCANVGTNDTLVLVDLGYTGTTQRLLAPIFRELGIDIVGRYLIALSTPEWQSSRAGLLDPSWCDDRVMHSLVEYIALLEQVCTENANSVIDYDEKGHPIFSTHAVNPAQHKKLASIQAECLHFIRDAKNYFATKSSLPTNELLREFATMCLARYLFLPTEQEIKYLQSFQFELNLGTNDVFRLIDERAGLRDLHRRGLFFIDKVTNAQSFRTNYPAELRSAGLELALTLMSHYRFGIEMSLKDMNLRHEQLKLIVIANQQSFQTTVEAAATFEGYYSMVVPLNISQMQLGIVFGEKYKWLQIEAAELIQTAALYQDNESAHTCDARHDLVFDKMIARGGNLYECSSETGLVMYRTPELMNAEGQVLRIIFRPLLTQAEFANSVTAETNSTADVNI